MGRLDPTSPGAGNRIYVNELTDAILKSKFMQLERISVDPIVLQYGTAGARVGVPALPTASAGGIDQLTFQSAFGHRGLEMHQTTAQTLMPLLHATNGLEIGLDKVDNESVEYVPGGNSAANPLGYTAGTDPGVFIEATFEFADTSGSDQFGIGFRKQEAYTAVTSLLSGGDALYTDFALLGFSGTAAANLVKSMTDLNNSGSTTVTSSAFPWADGGIHRLRVQVEGRRVSYFINGVRTGETVRKDALGASITAAPTVALPSFTFDSGDFLIPFIFHRFDATTPGAVYLRTLRVGPLAEVGLQKYGISRNVYV